MDDFVLDMKCAWIELAEMHGRDDQVYAFRIVTEFVDRFYGIHGNSVGGKLHIVLDDYNVEDEHIVYCREQARQCGDEQAYWLAQLLLLFSEEEREQMDWVSDDMQAQFKAKRAKLVAKYGTGGLVFRKPEP